ncbi:MAG TPA: lysyl oxidase family protein [Streptosporangiaceae bacterium]|nr:lysyl oxidase family protein [Streptosporangiaceae bacterium]
MSRSQQLAALTRPRVLALALALAALVAGLLSLGVPAARSAAARPAAAAGTPTIKLIAAQKSIEVGKFGKGNVQFDPGIWVASLGGAFQLDVKRANYTKPLTVTQVIKNSAGVTTERRALPARLLKGWNGLSHFLRLAIRHNGKVVARSTITFCPDNFSLSRTGPNSPRTDHYPQQCSAAGQFFGPGNGGGDAFSLGEVWGITRGWAVDPANFRGYKLGYGTYKLTESISSVYRRLFHITGNDAATTVTLKVVKARNCCGPVICCGSAKAPAVPAHFVLMRTRRTGLTTHGRLPSLPAARTLRQPPRDSLPDLMPLPSWGISVMNEKKAGDSYLDFGATVWIGGHAKLDVEGFRSNGSRLMRAYQYFWEHGRIVGRMPVGTMGFSNYNSWHFQQFAQYKLLNAKKKVIVVSRKIGFCIAPTDPINLLLRHATWVPSYTGIAGNCGSSTALWVQELLPLGWGDTYFQSVPYQSFEVTKIPNGTYYIEIIANPEHLLHEVNTANDISLRRIVIGGTPGHRTVRVPAYHGLDPEH